MRNSEFGMRRGRSNASGGLRTGTGAAVLLSVFLCASAGPASAQTTRPATSRSASEWSMFRGNPAQTGVATSRLPDKPQVRWTFECPEPVSSTAAIVDGAVYVGCDDGKLYCLDLATGKRRWTYPAGAPIRSSPTVLRDMPAKGESTVYFGDDDGVFHAVDAAGGKKRWTFKTDAEIISSANVWRDRVIFGSYDGYLYCLQARDGKLAWKYETEDRVHGTPGIVGDMALTAGCDSRLHFVRLTDGKSAAKVELGSYCGSSAAAAGGTVFLGTHGCQVLAVDARSRVPLWTFEDDERQFPYMSSAAVTERAIFIGGRDKRLRAIDPKSGKEIWSFATRGRIDASPVVVGRRVFVASFDGTLYAVNTATGKEEWRYETGPPIAASPAVAEGALVIGNDDGVVFCFGGKS